MKEIKTGDLHDLIKKIQDLGPDEREATDEEAKVITDKLAAKKQEEFKQRSLGKKRLQVKVLRDVDTKNLLQKAIFIDGELFDWDVDHEALEWAQRQGPTFFAVVQKDIAEHFLACLSEVVGREIRMQDFQNALKTGWI